MWGRTRRLREALADEKARTTLLRQLLADASEECASWKAQAAPAARIADQLITCTRERDTAQRELTATADDLRDARKRLTAYGHPHRITVSDVLEQHDATRKALADALGLGWHLNWEQLLTAAAQALAGHRREAAEQQAVVDRLTGQLFDAIGYQPAERARLDTPAQGVS